MLLPLNVYQTELYSTMRNCHITNEQFTRNDLNDIYAKLVLDKDKAWQLLPENGEDFNRNAYQWFTRNIGALVLRGYARLSFNTNNVLKIEGDLING